MARITRVEIMMVNLSPKVRRVDAIQTFVAQETPIVSIHDSDGAIGTGYTYTIGTGGPSVMALLEKTLAPALIGKEANRIDAIWRELLFLTHATSVGAITSLALAAIDTALWDLKCLKSGLPLHVAAGGTRDYIPLYTTEGGWLHLEASALVDDAIAVKEKGFKGAKIKIGRPNKSEDNERLRAVRKAVGDNFEIMTDGNQGFPSPKQFDECAFWRSMISHGLRNRFLLMMCFSIPDLPIAQVFRSQLEKVFTALVSSRII